MLTKLQIMNKLFGQIKIIYIIRLLMDDGYGK